MLSELKLSDNSSRLMSVVASDNGFCLKPLYDLHDTEKKIIENWANLLIVQMQIIDVLK